MKKTLSFVTAILISSNINAMYLSSFIYEMGSKEKYLSKYIKNDTNNENIYTIKSYAIDKPNKEKDKEKVILNKDKEILYAPLKLQINSNTSDYFKIIYNGPNDDKERYYRVVFTETPMSPYKIKNKNKDSYFNSSISLSTILIVRPRIQKLDYIVDEKEGLIKNTGNTFFRIIIHKSCIENDDTSEQLYLLPGEIFQDKSINQNNKKYIVANKQYIPIGTTCINKFNKKRD